MAKKQFSKLLAPLLKEASVPATTAKTIANFAAIIAQRIGLPLYGNPELVDTVNKTDDGVTNGVKYTIGNGKRAIRFNLPKNGNSTFSSIDFWTEAVDNPQFTIKGDYSVNQLLDATTEFISSGNTVINVFSDEKNKGLMEADIILTEDDDSGEEMVPFNKTVFLDKIQDKDTDFYEWISNVDWDTQIKTQSGSTGTIRNFLGRQKVAPIFHAYEKWAVKSKKKAMTYNSVNRFIKDAFRLGNLAKLEVVRVSNASSESYVPSSAEDAELLEKVQSARLTPDEVFEQMETYVEAVAKGTDYSLIICGDPGIGKTFGVTKKLKELGLSEAEELEEEMDISGEDEFADLDNDEDGMAPAPEQDNRFYFIKGKVSVLGCYSLMYKHNGQLIVFDDCDSIFDSSDGNNLIKNATDDKPERKVGMRNKSTLSSKSELPAAFNYSGRCIFITNKYFEDIDSAIVSRALVCEVDLTAEEVVARIRSILPSLLQDIKPKPSMKEKNEVLDYLLEVKYLYTKLDIRTFEKCVKEYMRGNPNWKRIVANSLYLKSKSLNAR